MSELMNLFTPDEKMELNYTEFAKLMKEAAKAELLTNAAKADVPSFYVNAMLTGQNVTFDETELTIEESEESLGEIAAIMEKLFKAKKNRKTVIFVSDQLMILVKMIRDGILFDMDLDEKEDEDDEQADGREENDRD